MTRNHCRQFSACLVVALLGLTGCHEGRHNSPTSPPDVIVGSGNVATEQRPISGVREVKLIGVGNIDLVQGGTENLIVEAEDNLLEYLTTEVVGGVLVISQDSHVSLQPTRRIVFHLEVPTLDRAELVGTGNIDCRRFESGRLTLSSVGVGNMSFSNVSLDELDVSLAGVGNVRLSGVTRSQRAVIAGVGTYEATHLDSAFARVELVSVGSGTVRVRDRLEAIVAGPGCLYYIGDPVVEASVSGAGCLERLN